MKSVTCAGAAVNREEGSREEERGERERRALWANKWARLVLLLLFARESEGLSPPEIPLHFEEEGGGMRKASALHKGRQNLALPTP